MNYQEFCVEQIYNVLSLNLNNVQLNSVPYKYALKSGLIRLYPETYCLNGTEFKFWGLNFSSNTWRGKEVWKKLLCSEAAYSLCEQIENGNLKYANNKPYYEHIVPANVTYKMIMDLNITPNKNNANIVKPQIKEILDKSKLIVLTRDEAQCLDNVPNNKFNHKDEELIETWLKNGEINNHIADAAINSMKSGSSYVDTKDNGTSYARFAHLINCGIKFVWGNNKSSLTDIGLITKYLNDTNHNI